MTVTTEDKWSGEAAAETTMPTTTLLVDVRVNFMATRGDGKCSRGDANEDGGGEVTV